MLYYAYPQIVVEEVPNEIALAISLSGCPLACKGCHSSETWDTTFGKPINTVILEALIKLNKHASCILFYGGEWAPLELEELFKACQKASLKICLYTGLELDQVPTNLLSYINIIKVGRYKEELGGLGTSTTNQRIITLR